MKSKANEGFSMIELLIVMTIILIMSSTGYYYLTAHQRLYKADDQALLITDVLQEARQRSLTQRETMRVEIDITANVVRLIDENLPTTANDDQVLRQITLLSQNDVKTNGRPAEIDNNPPEPYETPSAQFRQSSYPKSMNNQVCTLRFQSNGTVVDAGDNNIGSNAAQVGATIHIWLPNKTAPTTSSVARALTIIGSTGTIRLWEWNKTLTTTNKWVDTRRSGTYGG